MSSLLGSLGPDLFLRALSVLFQYGILAILFLFIMRLVGLIWQDIRRGKEKEHARDYEQGEAVLTILKGIPALEGKRFAFTKEIRIGRAQENDIIIEDSYVSHLHARIRLLNNQYVLEDMGSVNHTYLNDRILEKRAYLQTGDVIRIGLATFKFER